MNLFCRCKKSYNVLKNILLVTSILFIGCTKQFAYVDFDKPDQDTSLIRSVEKLMDQAFSLSNTDISKVDRQKIINKFYRQINFVTATHHGELITKLDLFKFDISQIQFKYCAISPLSIFLHRANMSRDNYSNHVMKFMQQLEKYTKSIRETQLIIYENALEKMIAMYSLVDQFSIPERYGAIFKVKEIAKPYLNKNNTSNIFRLIESTPEQESKALFQLLDDLDIVINLVERLPIMYPVYGARIMRHFGYRINPETTKIIQHKGIAFKGIKDSKIFATGKGRAIHAGPYKDLGNTVIIDHGNKIKSLYAHLEYPLLVQKGQKVDISQEIGVQNSSGNAINTFLYYQILLKDIPVDPRIFLEVGRKCNFR